LPAFGGERVEVDAGVWLCKLRKKLVARNYSRGTLKLYLQYSEEFLKFCNKAPYHVSNAEINCSASALNMAI